MRTPLRRLPLALTLSHVATRLWWRRLVVKAGTFLATALVVTGLAAGVGFWLWIWPQVRGPLDEIVRARPDLEHAMVVTVLIGFAVLVALLRVLLLAFDTISQDLRILLAVAPLPRLTRATVAIVPDLSASWLGAMCFGSVGLFTCASVAPHFGAGQALAWGTVIVVVIGALAAVLEWLGTRIAGDVPAARAMASVGILAGLCVAMGWVASSLQSDPLGGAATRFGRTFLGWGAAGSAALAVEVTGVALLVWGVAAGGTTSEIFRARGRRPRWRIPGGSVLGCSAVTFTRDAGNRFALLSLAALGATGLWLESVTGLPVAGALIAAAIVIVISGAAVLSYGDFEAVRWRVHTGPADPRRVLGAWLAGHLLGALIIAGVAVATAAAARPELVSGWGHGWATACLVGLGAGTLAGRLVPYRREDVFSVASTGLLDLSIALPCYALIDRVLEPLGVSAPLGATVFAVAALLVVLLAERADRPAPGEPRRNEPGGSVETRTVQVGG